MPGPIFEVCQFGSDVLHFGLLIIAGINRSTVSSKYILHLCSMWQTCCCKSQTEVSTFASMLITSICKESLSDIIISFKLEIDTSWVEAGNCSNGICSIWVALCTWLIVSGWRGYPGLCFLFFSGLQVVGLLGCGEADHSENRRWGASGLGQRFVCRSEVHVWVGTILNQWQRN